MEVAKTAFDRAINKFERHAMAYERRGKVNMKLNNSYSFFVIFEKKAL